MFQGIVDIMVIEGLLMKRDIDETRHVMIGHEVGPLTQMQVDHSYLWSSMKHNNGGTDIFTYRFFSGSLRSSYDEGLSRSKYDTSLRGIFPRHPLWFQAQMILDQSTEEFAIHFPFPYSTIGFVVTMILMFEAKSIDSLKQNSSRGLEAKCSEVLKQNANLLLLVLVYPRATEELVNRRVEEALAAYEATSTANALEAESQSQNGSDGDNGNGGNGNGGDGNGGDGNGGDGNGGNGNGRNGNPNENNRGARPVVRECTYQDFMKCQPLNFKGTEGVVGLIRWFEKMETVFHISNCLEKYQVKYTTCILLNSALTRWNSHKRTIGADAAFSMS
ncbi:hypothetical protein Tco_0299984 [Tanacetum coccineum]